jgi:hypothetical protein
VRVGRVYCICIGLIGVFLASLDLGNFITSDKIRISVFSMIPSPLLNKMILECIYKEPKPGVGDGLGGQFIMMEISKGNDDGTGTKDAKDILKERVMLQLVGEKHLQNKTQVKGF